MTVTCLSQVNLECKKGSSDKVYIIQVQQHETAAGTEYVSIGYYGRAGSPSSKAEQYRGPSLPSAQAAAARIERDKRTGSSGYSTMSLPPGGKVPGMPAAAPVFGGTPAAGAASPATAPAAPVAPTGIVPMRANAMEMDDVEKYLTDPNWVAQRKYDGERSPVSIRRSIIAATNLKGNPRGLAASSEAELKKLTPRIDFSDERETLVDGEELPGGVFVIYDVVTMRDNDVRKYGFEERYGMLEEMLSDNIGLLAPVAWSEPEKRAMLAKARTENWEGMMFRRIDASYCNGRTSDILKLKLWASATCRVLTVNAKRSVQIAVVDEKGDEVNIGNVTVPVNQPIPAADDLVEVRYLYAMEGGSLYQPVLLNIRKDKDEADLRSSLRPAPPEKGGPSSPAPASTGTTAVDTSGSVASITDAIVAEPA